MKSLILSALVLATSPAAVAAPAALSSACVGHIVPTGADAAEWLKDQELTQADLEQAFRCATVPATLPTGKGIGWGSVRAANKLWNDLQTKVGGLLWGGKVFTTENGQTTLINLMNDSDTTRYHAAVYPTTSIYDGQPAIVLDYRIDETATATFPDSPAQAILDPIIHGVRDEIRELLTEDVDGTLHGTGVYIGRAYLYDNLLTVRDITISDAAFGSADAYFLAANFFLDFRSASN